MRAPRLELILLLGLAACRSTGVVAPPPLPPRVLDDPLCGPYGCPRTTVLMESQIVRHTAYLLDHSNHRKTALWVVHHPSRAEVEAEVDGGRPKWRADPNLPPEARAEDDDYRAATDTYDRGHLAPNADFGTKELRKETFFLSNAVPQVSAHNQGLWRMLEERVRAWVKARGALWIITGPIYRGPGTAIGPGRVAVPDAMFKILLAQDEAGNTEVLAFIADNRAYPPPYDFSALLESVDEVERLTGLNFFPELSAEEERRLEAKASALW